MDLRIAHTEGLLALSSLSEEQSFYGRGDGSVLYVPSKHHAQLEGLVERDALDSLLEKGALAFSYAGEGIHVECRHGASSVDDECLSEVSKSPEGVIARQGSQFAFLAPHKTRLLMSPHTRVYDPPEEYATSTGEFSEFKNGVSAHFFERLKGALLYFFERPSCVIRDYFECSYEYSLANVWCIKGDECAASSPKKARFYYGLSRWCDESLDPLIALRTGLDVVIKEGSQAKNVLEGLAKRLRPGRDAGLWRMLSMVSLDATARDTALNRALLGVEEVVSENFISPQVWQHYGVLSQSYRVMNHSRAKETAYDVLLPSAARYLCDRGLSDGKEYGEFMRDVLVARSVSSCVRSALDHERKEKNASCPNLY